MHQDEDHSGQRREHQEYRGEITGEMPYQQEDLHPAGAQILAQQGFHAVDVQAEAFEQQQREEQEGLVLGHPAEEPRSLGGLFGG